MWYHYSLGIQQKYSMYSSLVNSCSQCNNYYYIDNFVSYFQEILNSLSIITAKWHVNTKWILLSMHKIIIVYIFNSIENHLGYVKSFVFLTKYSQQAVYYGISYSIQLLPWPEYLFCIKYISSSMPSWTTSSLRPKLLFQNEKGSFKKKYKRRVYE